MDERDSAIARLKSGHRAIVPVEAHESELIRRIDSTDPDDQMPPPDSGKALTVSQKKLLRQWIVEGAKWEEHWAFIAPEKNLQPPSIRDNSCKRISS